MYCITGFVCGEVKMKVVETFSSGFLLGMLAMYIAIHVYEY